MCWTCSGNGLIPVVQPGAWGSEFCPDCNATGCNIEKKNYGIYT